MLRRSTGIEIRPLSYYAHIPNQQEPGLVMGYGRLPLRGVPGVVGALARAMQSA